MSYVVVNFPPQIIFVLVSFLLFLGMVMYDNEVGTTKIINYLR